MVTAPSDLVLAQSPGSPRSPRPSVLRTAGALGSTSSSSSAGSSLAARVSVLKGPSRSSVPVVVMQHQHPQRQRRRLQPHRERWPWSLTPREDARVPAPHEVPKTAYASPVILRLGVRTATLVRDNQELQRRLAVLRAETHAVLSALKRAGRPPASSPSPPPSSPASSSSSASSPWSSPPPSPGSACQYSPASPDSGCDNDFVDSEPGSPDSRA